MGRWFRLVFGVFLMMAVMSVSVTFAAALTLEQIYGPKGMQRVLAKKRDAGASKTSRVLPNPTARRQGAPDLNLLGKISRATTVEQPAETIAPFNSVIQINLRFLGYYSQDIDNDAGAATRSALKRFQKRYSLSESGIYDPTTAKKMKQLIAAKQRRIFGGAVDGVWAPRGKCGLAEDQIGLQGLTLVSRASGRLAVPKLNFLVSGPESSLHSAFDEWQRPLYRVRKGRLMRLDAHPPWPIPKPVLLVTEEVADNKPVKTPTQKSKKPEKPNKDDVIVKPSSSKVATNIAKDPKALLKPALAPSRPSWPIVVDTRLLPVKGALENIALPLLAAAGVVSPQAEGQPKKPEQASKKAPEIAPEKAPKKAQAEVSAKLDEPPVVMVASTDKNFGPLTSLALGSGKVLPKLEPSDMIWLKRFERPIDTFGPDDARPGYVPELKPFYRGFFTDVKTFPKWEEVNYERCS